MLKFICPIVSRIDSAMDEYNARRAEIASGCKIKIVDQGFGHTMIGSPQNFKIDRTSDLKSGSFIECQGGVKIGKYFHPGRGLTIFSGNHNYDGGHSIPYDKESVSRPVEIKDFVWCGANVTIIPGVTVGEGAIIGAGSVVVKDVPDYAVVGGNPAKILKYRNKDQFIRLKIERNFF